MKWRNAGQSTGAVSGQILRLLKLGVMDFAGMDISKMAGDDPRFEACDLAGLTLDPDEALRLQRLP